MGKVTTDSIKLTKAEKKAQKELKKAEEQRIKKEKEYAAQELAIRLAGQSESESKSGVRKDVRAELKEMYKNGEFASEEDYKAAKKYTNKGNIFQRIWGKPTESSNLFKREAAKNRYERIKEEGGPELTGKLKEKFEQSGISTEELYEIYDRNRGDEYEISYSYKKKQPGEADGLKAELNNKYANIGNVEFTKKDAKNIAKKMGLDVEKAVDYGKVTRDALTGAVVGAPFAFAGAKAHAESYGLNGAVAIADAKVSLGAVPAVVGAVAGGAASAIKQATRVETKAADKLIPENVMFYKEYAQYLDDYATKDNAEIMKKIATFYIDGYGIFHKAELQKRLKQAAGESSVLNPKEAQALYADLVQNPPKLEEPVLVQPKKEEKCKITETEETQVVDSKIPTVGYTIKSGDNWNAIVLGKYQPKTDEDRRLLIRALKDAAFEDMKKNGTLPAGVTKSTDAFFGKVKDVLQLPEKIELPNGKTYEYKDGAVKAGDLGGKVATYIQSDNAYTKQEEQTTYGYETSCGGKATGLSKEERDKQVKDRIDSGEYELVH